MECIEDAIDCVVEVSHCLRGIYEEEPLPPRPQLVDTYTQTYCDINCQNGPWGATCTVWGVYSDGSQRVVQTYRC